jgi:hypothetical protein
MKTILALQPHNREIGFAVFEDNKLVDWGLKAFLRVSVFNRTDEMMVDSFRKLARKHRPDVVVLPPPTALSETFRSHFVRTVRQESFRRSQEIADFSLDAISECFGSLSRLNRVNKEIIRKAIVKWFPELEASLPKRRRLWERQDYWAPMFDAVALAITWLYHNE